MKAWHCRCSPGGRAHRAALGAGIGRGGAATWMWQEVSVAKEDRGFASMDRAKQREIATFSSGMTERAGGDDQSEEIR